MRPKQKPKFYYTRKSYKNLKSNQSNKRMALSDKLALLNRTFINFKVKIRKFKERWTEK